MKKRGFPLFHALGNGMEKCKNPEICKRKYLRWSENQKKYIPLGEEEHEVFLQHFVNNSARISNSCHADRRQFERVVNVHDVMDVIKNGWVIERNYFPDEQAVSLVILGYTRKYRPIHVVCTILSDNHWKIKTVYSPLSKKYKWSEDFTERICFCKKD